MTQTRSWSVLASSVLVAIFGVSCAAQSPHETRVNDAASTQRSAGARKSALKSQRRESQRLGYSWTLPKGWEFVDPGLFWKFAPTKALDVHAAQGSPDGPFVLVIVTDVIHTVPRKHPGDDPKDYEKLERDAADELRRSNVQPVDTRRIKTFDTHTIEVIGERGELRTSIRALFVGYRRFEFRCYGLRQQGDAPCGSGLSEFIIQDVPEPPAEQDVPRVRHLRDARFGVAFDAPDDSWLSVGPYSGHGGAQVVWTWTRGRRQIDIHVIDLDSVVRQPGQTAYAAAIAGNSRASNLHVVENQVAFAGQLWEHHEMNSNQHGAQDLFILVQRGIMYNILVTQPTRDLQLIDAAKKGFKLLPRLPR